MQKDNQRYLNIKINSKTSLNVGIETTTYRDRFGHYVYLIREKRYTVGTFMREDAYQRLIELMRKYDETIL